MAIRNVKINHDKQIIIVCICLKVKIMMIIIIKRREFALDFTFTSGSTSNLFRLKSCNHFRSAEERKTDSNGGGGVLTLVITVIAFGKKFKITVKEIFYVLYLYFYLK